MEFWLLLIGLGFLGVLLGAVYFGIAEPRKKQVYKGKDKISKTTSQNLTSAPEVYPKLVQLQKALTSCEHRRTELETQIQSLQAQVQALKDLDRKETEDKARIDFDQKETERLRGEFMMLKQVLAAKEEQLEKEISLKHRQDQEAVRFKMEHDALVKKCGQLSENLQKTESLSEALSRELEQAKRKLSEQDKIVRLHQESKTEGEWVSRQEIDRLHQQISDKEKQIQVLLIQRNRPAS